MNFETVRGKIEEWLQPVLKENQYLVDVKFPAGRKIEVFVDSDEGIHIDDCAAISRHLEKHLDGSGIVPDNYILEVSSPGMSNPLKIPRQYKRRVGQILEIITQDGKQINAKVEEVKNETVLLREVKESEKKKVAKGKKTELEEGSSFELPFTDIKRAVIKMNW